jgi:hypothetical protein
MQATVEVEQTLPNGGYVVGTGFLISDPTPDGRGRTVLVTANHVFERMVGAQAYIGYRVQNADGSWRYDPQPIAIRSGAKQLWTHHPNRDVAAITIKAPPAFAKAAIPLDWLASSDTISKYAIGPGDEMMVLGYPQGLSADTAGFPILRSGRVASMIEAPTASPTFLLDFRVFPGNSGGPVFIVQQDRRHPGSTETEDVQFVTGMLTQQVELNNERLEIGIVTDAAFIRDTVALIDREKARPDLEAIPVGPPAPPPPGATDVAAVGPAAAAVGQAVAD